MRKYMFACTVDDNGLPKGPKARHLSTEETEELNMILLAFADIDDLTKETAKKISLKVILKVVLNRIGTGDRRKTKFPQSAIDIAQNAWNKYMSRYDPNDEGEEWGVEPENAQLGPEDILEDPEVEGSTSPRQAQRRRMSSTVIQASSINGRFARPSRNHTIFGTEGMMRGILCGRGNEGRIGYRFDPYFPRRNFNVFGPNGCTVGDWWPQQIAVVRDGAHGHIMGGIAGTPNEGVWSIVISGNMNLTKDNMLSKEHLANRFQVVTKAWTKTAATRSYTQGLEKVLRTIQQTPPSLHEPPRPCRMLILLGIRSESSEALGLIGEMPLKLASDTMVFTESEES